MKPNPKAVLLALAMIGHAYAAEEEAPGDVYLEQPDGGAINARTGEYYPPAGPNGVIDAQTGEYYPKAGPDGFIDPKTGQYYPAVD